MTVLEDLRKNVDPTPLYAVVGATDLAVEKAREARLDITKRAALMHKAAQASTGDVGHLYLLSAPYFIVHSAKIKDFVWKSDVYYNFDSPYRIE